MLIARASRQAQVTKIRAKVVVERSLAFLVLMVLTSCGRPTSIPVAVPIQLKVWDSSIELLSEQYLTYQYGVQYIFYCLRMIYLNE